jgi:signal transduction histidine kinase
MKTGYKLFLGFFIVIILLWVTVYFANNTYGKIRKEFKSLEEEVIPGVMEMSDMVVLANEIVHSSIIYIYYGEEEAKQETISGVEQLQNLGLSNLQRVKYIVQEEQKEAQELVSEISVFSSSVLAIVNMKDKEMDLEHILVMEKSVHFLQADLIERFVEYKDKHMQELAAAEEEVHRAHATGAQILFTVAGMTTIIALLAALFVTRSIIRPLHALHKGTEVIGQGNLNYRVGTNARDEIGQLSRAFDRMTEGLAETTASITELNKEIVQRQKAECELQEKNQQLDSQNIKLQELDRLKSVFLASMSHELRTPLNAIIGFTSLILQGMVGEINEEQSKQLSLVDSSAHHLLSLINDILDIAKIEAGRVELQVEEFPLDDLVEEVVATLSPIADLKNIELSKDVPEGVMLYSDKRRLMQVLINLTGNAIKFTEKGSVRIKVGLLEDGTLKVSVVDTGIGLKKGDVAKLFTPFQQVGDSMVKKTEGTGLGLYLSKKLVTLMGGDIWVESEFGKGSEFIFTLPLKYTEA